jgi:hypothetical protein
MSSVLGPGWVGTWYFLFISGIRRMQWKEYVVYTLYKFWGADEGICGLCL